MKYVWVDNTDKNTVLEFSVKTSGDCDTLIISAVDFYQVFLDGKFAAFGPSRTAAGYSRPKTVKLNGATEVLIKVNWYGVPTYACDYSAPYFGAEILKDGQVALDTTNFTCVVDSSKLRTVPKFSYQHGFLEVYDFNNEEKTSVKTHTVNSPVLINSEKDTCDYNKFSFERIASGAFNGFEQVKTPWWINGDGLTASEKTFDVSSDFIKETETGYEYVEYVLPCEKTGFICLNIDAVAPCQAFVVFEEIKPDGKWIFGRSHCYDVISLKCKTGYKEFISLEPYSFKYLRIIYKGDAKFTPSIIAVENNRVDKSFSSCDDDLNLIYNSAKESFCQNAFDIFTDCPTRERAGWLCDSFFLARAEKYFTGANAVERAFLENYLLAETTEIVDGMFPKCFPAEHKDKVYIPNWAMWLVLEIKDHLLRTGDRRLIDDAKPKIYALVNFFDKYINDDGLLENLESWVFVDYSDSNTRPYLAGVNYPSNMLYAQMLDAVDYLYSDNALKARAEGVRKTVIHQSFNGEFFIENAIRVDGVLTPCADHITEAAQYYALCTDTYTEKQYSERVKTGLGPLNREDYPNVSRSTGFVGIYLRLLWLDKIGESKRVVDEIKEYFLPMAKTTGTLWEYDSPQASCNHGFTSIAAYWLDKNTEK